MDTFVKMQSKEQMLSPVENMHNTLTTKTNPLAQHDMRRVSSFSAEQATTFNAQCGEISGIPEQNDDSDESDDLDRELQTPVVNVPEHPT